MTRIWSALKTTALAFGLFTGSTLVIEYAFRSSLPTIHVIVTLITIPGAIYGAILIRRDQKPKEKAS
jgi:hypothetical protein